MEVRIPVQRCADAALAHTNHSGDATRETADGPLLALALPLLAAPLSPRAAARSDGALAPVVCASEPLECREPLRGGDVSAACRGRRRRAHEADARVSRSAVPSSFHCARGWRHAGDCRVAARPSTCQSDLRREALPAGRFQGGAARALAVIPAGASVVAQSPIVPHLSHRAEIFVLDARAPDAAYVIAAPGDVSPWPLERPDDIRRLIDERRSRGYRPVFQEGNWIVLARQ